MIPVARVKSKKNMRVSLSLRYLNDLAKLALLSSCVYIVVRSTVA